MAGRTDRQHTDKQLDPPWRTLSNKAMIYALPLLAYLVGSISAAILIARVYALSDPRAVGSGNPGTTNILRQGNKTAALLTLLGDVLKGTLPVLAARLLDADPPLVAAVGAAALIGHVFPVYYAFHGGKGVATGLGVYLALSWPLALSLVACWLLVAAVFRYSSLAAVTASALSPLLSAYWLPIPAYLAMSVLLAVLLVWRHGANIRRLMSGQEDKIRLSKSP